MSLLKNICHQNNLKIMSNHGRDDKTGYSWMDYFYTSYNPSTGKLEQTAKEEPKTCTCGIHVTMGKHCDLEFHSKWCDLLDKNKENS